jgi:hypothetical protein
MVAPAIDPYAEQYAQQPADPQPAAPVAQQTAAAPDPYADQYTQDPEVSPVVQEAAPAQQPYTSTNLPETGNPQPQTAAPAAPAAAPTNTYTPGTNAILDTLYNAGDKVGDAVEAVGGKDLRQAASGFAPPIQEIAEAKSPLDKVMAASNYWDRPAQAGQEVIGDQAIAANQAGGKAGSEPYSLTSPQGIGTALGQFDDEITDYAQHPEHLIPGVLSSIPRDSAEGDSVFGDQGFNDWAAAHQDKVTAAGSDGDALYQEYLRDIGYTSEKGGLGGMLKGMVQQSLTDESLLPAIGMGEVATTAAKAAHAGDVGMARGILIKGTEAANKAIQGPEQLLFDQGAGLISKGVNSALGQKIPGLGLFRHSAETQQKVASQVYDEATLDVARTREAQLPGFERAATTLAAPDTLPPPNPSPSSPPTTGVPIGGRALNEPAARPATAEWLIKPEDNHTYVNGRLATKPDLAAARDAWIDTPPRTIRGFDQEEILTGASTDPIAHMRAGLTQGLVDVDGRKGPYFADDVSRARMADQRAKGQPLDPARAAAGGRFIDAQAQRFTKYGEEEVTHVLQKLNQDKYRGVRGNTQPMAVWYDNKRLAMADALRASDYQGPVDLGYRHKFDPTTGQFIVDTTRPIRVNSKAPGTPLNISDFEPDIPTWQAIQQSALRQGNPPELRVTTAPPASRPAPSIPAATRPLVSAPTNASVPPSAVQNAAQRLVQPTTRARMVKPGFAEHEFDGVLVPEGMQPLMRTKAGEKTVFRHITDAQDDIHTLQDVATGKQHLPQEVVDDLTNTYTQKFKELYGKDAEPNFAAMSPQQIADFAANVAHKNWFDTLPPLAKRSSHGVGAKLLQANSDVASFRSAMGLHNWATAPRQVVVQTTGNMWTMLLTKPSALTAYADPRRWRQFANAAREARREGATGPYATYAAKSSSAKGMEGLGLSTNSMINPDAAKSLAGGSGRSINSPILRAFKDKAAPDVLRDWAALPDAAARDAVTSVEFTPRVRSLQKGLGQQSQSLAGEWVRSGKLAVPPGEVQKAVNGVLNAHYSGSSRFSEVTAPQLEEALLKYFDGAANKTGLREFADRVARDYKTQLNTVYQQTARETRRVFFSWDSTTLDEVLRHVMLYHYWSSRASALYARNMIQNPWMAGNMVRMAQGAYEEAQQGDYPLWMQGFGKMLSSPAGSILFGNPFSMMSAAMFFADWQYGMDSARLGEDLTFLGRARGIFPFMINPLIDSLAWGMGLYGGEDAGRLINEPTGAERIPRDVIQLLNLAGVNGDLGPLTPRDEHGNFVPIPERPITDLWARFTSALTGVVREDPQPIPNLYASTTSAEQAHLLDILVEDHPSWTEDMITREMNNQIMAAQTGKASDELVEAQKRALEGQLRGPEFSQLPEGIRGVVGGVVRHLSPMQMMARPEMAMALKKVPVSLPGREQPLPTMQDSYDQMDMSSALYDTPEMTKFNTLVEDSYGDPNVSAASMKAKAIRDATNEDGEVVNGVHYSQDQLHSMTDTARSQLGYDAMREMGVKGEDVASQYAMSDALEANNPDLQAYRGYLDAAKADPDGVEHFVDTQYASDPAFARMMDRSGKPRLLDDGTPNPEWYDVFKRPEVFYGAAGNRTSNYDPTSDLPESTLPVDQYAADREESKAAAADDSYTKKLERSTNELMAAQDLLDQEYPDYGYTVGSGNLPSDVWNHMKEVWGANDIDTAYITKPTHYGKQYVDWLATSPDDRSIQAYLNATIPDDGSNKFLDGSAVSDASTPSTQSQPINLDAPLDYGRLSQRFGLPADTGSAGTQIATPRSAVTLRQSPGGQGVTVIPPNLALRVLDVQGDWAHVSAPGGFEGYVPTTSLQKAAA